MSNLAHMRRPLVLLLTIACARQVGPANSRVEVQDSGVAADAADDADAGAVFDASVSLDLPEGISIWNSSLSACAGIAPIDVGPPTTFRFEAVRPPRLGRFAGFAVDGSGHVAVTECCSGWDPGSPSETWLFSLDGGLLAGQFYGDTVVSETAGFLFERIPMDVYQTRTLSSWSPDGGFELQLSINLLGNQQPEPYCSYAQAPDESGFAACTDVYGMTTLLRLDSALRPFEAPRPFSSGMTVRSIDARGFAIVVDSDGGTRWADLDAGILSAPVEGGLSWDARRLVGGGFDSAAGELASWATTYSPRPNWLAERAGLRLPIVRAGRAYASVAFESSVACKTRLELLALDGTICAALEATAPLDAGACTPPQLRIGANGVVYEHPTRPESCDEYTCNYIARIWPDLLR